MDACNVEPRQELEQLRAALELSQLRRTRLEQDNARLTQRYLAAEKQNTALITLFTAVMQLNPTLGARTLIARLEEILRDLLGAQRYALFLLDHRQKALRCTRHAPLDQARPATLTLEESPVGQCAASRATIISRIACDTSTSTMLCVPLSLHEVCLGVLAVYDWLPHRREARSIDLEVLDVVGEQIAIALYAAFLFDQVAQHSIIESWDHVLRWIEDQLR